MTEAWEHWEGHLVEGRFPLRQQLGGCRHSAVFLTDYGGQEPRKAAIKLVAADPQDTELQLHRWELAAKLSHPHLIRLLEMGRCQLSDRALLYVVMEYAEEDLSEVLRQRALTPAEVREMLLPALDALAYLHEKGFVHGHLKPANVLAIDDQLKLSSDGIRPAGDSRAHREERGVYDPPEVAGGGNSPAGDVWSLGATLVEALTQCPPARDGTEQKAAALPAAIPAPFGEIAHHCLQRDPRRRWTVADIAAQLRGQTAARAQDRLGKRRYILPAAALGLALAAVLVVPRLVNRRREAPRSSSIPLEQPAVQSKNVEAKPPAGSLFFGAVVHQVLPEVPAQARNTIRGTVRVSVRVQVDPTGSVAGAKLDSAGPSPYFAGLALKAAPGWKFKAPQVGGRDVSSEWVLRFAFGATSTTALAVRVAP